MFRHAADVLLLSRITGQDVRGRDGQSLGHLADLPVSLGDQSGPLLVDGVLVRRHRTPDLLVPWTSVTAFQQNGITLADDADRFAIRSITDALDADQILLRRDVLDTQVVDTAGQRLARVADVVLARTADGHLELIGVEVGFGAVLRRLGLNWLAARAPADAIAWNDLHLTSERGHAVQLATPRSAVHLLDARGLAALVSRLDTESATEVLTAKGPHVAADVVRASHPVVAERVLRALPDTDVVDIVAAMPPEHATRWRDRLAHRPLMRGRRLLRHTPRGSTA